MNKKMMVGMLSGFLFLAMGPHQSFADQRGCGCRGGGDREIGMHGGPSMHHGRGAGEGLPRVLWKELMRLDLSDKQRDAFAAIRSRVMKDAIRKRADLELARVDLRESLEKDTVDMKAVEANLKKAEALRTDLRLSHIRAFEEIKAQLTPEQRTRLKEQVRAGFRGERIGYREQGAPAYGRMHDEDARAGGE